MDLSLFRRLMAQRRNLEEALNHFLRRLTTSAKDKADLDESKKALDSAQAHLDQAKSTFYEMYGQLPDPKLYVEAEKAERKASKPVKAKPERKPAAPAKESAGRPAAPAATLVTAGASEKKPEQSSRLANFGSGSDLTDR